MAEPLCDCQVASLRPSMDHPRITRRRRYKRSSADVTVDRLHAWLDKHNDDLGGSERDAFGLVIHMIESTEEDRRGE